jgi:thiosulfate dehydrogenase
MIKPIACSSTMLALLLAVAFVSALGAEDPSSDPPRKLPPGRLGEVVELGRRLVHETSDHPMSAPYVGNDLNCTSCHLDDGQHPTAGSFLGVAAAYPAWSPREERVITLEDRILNCFMRSENGVRPPNGGEVSVAISAYITWLSEGEPIEMNAKQPLGPNAVEPIGLDPDTADTQRGAHLYGEHCSACHGSDGVGSDDGPPVWGDRSYNRGAGLAQNVKLASWLKVAMPLGDPILNEKEALDIAAYVNSHERPGFVLEDHQGSPKP